MFPINVHFAAIKIFFKELYKYIFTKYNTYWIICETIQFNFQLLIYNFQFIISHLSARNLSRTVLVNL